MKKNERLELIRERVEKFYGMHDSLAATLPAEDDIAEERELFRTTAEPTPADQKADQWQNELIKDLLMPPRPHKPKKGKGSYKRKPKHKDR